MTVTTTPPGLDATVAHYDAIDRMPQWVVYERPRDFPTGFVARMHFALPAPEPTGCALYAATLDELRAALPVGLCCLDRFEGDDPAIVEVWI